MNGQENTPEKMKSLSINRHESLLNVLDEMVRNTGLDGKENLVSFLAQKVFGGESSLDTPGEEYKIKR